MLDNPIRKTARGGREMTKEELQNYLQNEVRCGVYAT